jgi:hypothetical protein
MKPHIRVQNHTMTTTLPSSLSRRNETRLFWAPHVKQAQMTSANTCSSVVRVKNNALQHQLLSWRTTSESTLVVAELPSYVF